MAQITISCSIPVPDDDVADVSEFLHKLVGRSRISTARMLRMGETGCFYTCPLYTDEHVKLSRLIRRMLAFFEAKAIPLTILKIGAQDSWYEVDPERRDPWKISPQALLALLDATPDGGA
ncbi:hypothetical protein O0880_27740 [Janthinobacterium sp. SUN118]|uniref:hypothetical protein n=1 Tax=Janthinobacterium sp. SUN118 TaxID=3004100 RepID=UPI0025AEE455|nr:hypothetical protein [Janthinobacterium sp. SUN118]MDN2713217.1 hypothetical protein [Janthinobacterium sp. SUN118]